MADRDRAEQLRALQNDPGLRRFLLPNVRSTGRELGAGSYGSVEELEVGGLVCAGKKIYEVLVQAGNPNIVQKYQEECQLMSDLRHPHIVQFMGICFLPPAALPVLIMEKLHTSLDDLLTRYARHPPLLVTPDIPLCLKWSFLVDIVRGLVFLHRHSPSSIIHRDLSAKNVLLSLSMVAKISDLGNARIVDFQPGQLARTQTRVPGTPVYMPPEAFDQHSRYGPRLDLFSFGHLALYTLIQVFPCDLLPHTYPDPDAPRGLFRRRRVLGRTEVERRGNYITQLHQQLGEGHPLVQLVERCLANEAEDRPSADEVLQQLEGMDIDDPHRGFTRLDMIRMIGQNEEEIQRNVQESQQMVVEIQQRDEEIQRRNVEIKWREEEIQRLEEEIQQREEEIQRNVQESQQKGVEIQRRDEEIQRNVQESQQKDVEIQQKEQMIEQMGEEVRQRDVVIHHRDEEIQRKEDEVRRMSEEIRRKVEEKQSLQSQVLQLQAQVQEVEAAKERKAARVEALTNQVQGLEGRVEQLDSEKDREQAQHTSEVEALSEQVSALSEDNSNLSSLVEAKTRSLGVKVQQIEVLRRELVVKERQVEGKGKEVEAKQQQIDSVSQQAQAHTEVVHSLQEQLSAKEQELSTKEHELSATKEGFITQLSATKDASREQLSAKAHELSALQKQIEGIAQERDALQLELVPLREGLQTKDAEIAVQRERVRTTEEEVGVKAAEITAKDALLQSKERMVQSLRREVESVRQRGPEQVTILHPGGVSLEWTQCADLPVGMCDAQAVQLRTKVYVQGDRSSAETDYNIYMYGVPTGVWVSMKSPTRFAALTIYRSQLVLVGGIESTTGRVTNRLWVLQDEQTWTQPLPPMPTARHSASAISSGDHLVVAGGEDQGFSELNLVEVYDGLQWVGADPLPVACSDIKSTYHSGMWYLMGGIGQSRSVLYTSLHSLIEKATQQPPHSPDSSEQQSVWKTLPDVPNKYSSTTTLGGALLAVGGRDSGGKKSSSVHMYSPLTRLWLHVGDMPEAVSSTCCITLTTGETMVIGGYTEGGTSPHVHKVCRLKLQ